MNNACKTPYKLICTTDNVLTICHIEKKNQDKAEKA
jgi:hypothetical protein